MTKKPAIITPIEINPIAFQYLTPNRWATRLPLHDPDPGRGIATNTIIKIRPYCANFFLCLFRVLSNRYPKKRSMCFECFLRKLVIGPRTLRIMKFGSIFPVTPMRNAMIGESPMLIPMGIPSLSSIPGSIDPKNVAVSGVKRSLSMCPFNSLFVFE